MFFECLLFVVWCSLHVVPVNVYSTGYVVDTINGFVKSLTFFHTYLIFFFFSNCGYTCSSFFFSSFFFLFFFLPSTISISSLMYTYVYNYKRWNDYLNKNELIVPNEIVRL